MRKETLEELNKRRVYIISDRTARICQLISLVLLITGLLSWWLLDFSWLFWSFVGLITVWSMILERHVMSESKFALYRGKMK